MNTSFRMLTAYNETCASIGLVMWAYRMFLIEPKAEYFDVIERALLNVNLAAVSLDGKKFFYENMLRRAKKLEYKLIWPLTRTEYLISYCCPPNLARMVTQSGEYAYTVSADSVYTGIYGECDAVLTLENGASFTLKQKTEYPYNGKIVFEFENVSCDRPVTLNLRIPKWAEAGSIKVGAEERKLDKTTRESYQAVHIEKLAGTRVELELEMPVRFTMAHPMVEEDSQLIAVEKVLWYTAWKARMQTSVLWMISALIFTAHSGKTKSGSRTGRSEFLRQKHTRFFMRITIRMNCISLLPEKRKRVFRYV